VNDAYGVAPGGQLVVGPAPGVLANDSDANGDYLSAVLVTTTSHGTLQLNANGSFIYSPVPGYTGIDSFGYRASDGLLSSPKARVVITVQ